MSVWWDRDIVSGQNWDDTIAAALHSASCIVVIWSRASTVSEWVRIEANVGRERKKLVPVLIEDVEIPLTFKLVQTTSLIEWDGTESWKGFATLLSGIYAILEREKGDSSGPAITAPERRALDVAVKRELIVGKTANLIGMIRLAESTGLRALLEAGDEYGLAPDEVASKPFDLDFSIEAGRPVPAMALLRVTSPGFSPASQEKEILVHAERDSTEFSFLLTPVHTGDLKLQLEVYRKRVLLVSRVLSVSGVLSTLTATSVWQVASIEVHIQALPGLSETRVGPLASQPAPQPRSPSQVVRTSSTFPVVLIPVTAALMSVVAFVASQPGISGLPHTVPIQQRDTNLLAAIRDNRDTISFVFGNNDTRKGDFILTPNATPEVMDVYWSVAGGGFPDHALSLISPASSHQLQGDLLGDAALLSFRSLSKGLADLRGGIPWSAEMGVAATAYSLPIQRHHQWDAWTGQLVDGLVSKAGFFAGPGLVQVIPGRFASEPENLRLAIMPELPNLRLRPRRRGRVGRRKSS